MDPAVLVALVVAATTVIALLAVATVSVSARRRMQTQLDAARADMEALRTRVDGLSVEATRDRSADVDDAAPDFVITRIGERAEATGRDLAEPQTPPAHLTAGEFTSVALGESLVRVLSLGYGVRRALSAENRNRIRFEMRREVRRSRKQRRRDLRTAARAQRTQGARAEDHAA